tara:strand:- start:5678 stop:5779 length:102 start_codon:yes stop_codon:yes gene_type:complete
MDSSTSLCRQQGGGKWRDLNGIKCVVQKDYERK